MTFRTEKISLNVSNVKDSKRWDVDRTPIFFCLKKGESSFKTTKAYW